MTLKIEINADNVAFEGSPNLEMARILRDFAKALETYTARTYKEWQLQDINGNTVGTATITQEEESLPCFEKLLRDIRRGYYDDENGAAQFKHDVLAGYGEEHEEAFSRLMQRHRDLTWRSRLEEVLGDLIKQIG